MRRPVFLALLALSLAHPTMGDAQSSTDSLGMLRELDDAVRANPGDHAAWYRRGMLAWTIARAQRRVTNVEPDGGPSLLEVADSSLQRALKLQQNEPRYLIELGRFRWSSTASLTRRRSSGMYERALALARKQGDSAAMA